MGAPKQKWTAEEEAALKAGIKKHGAGKWRTILRDPEFSDVLSLRSNVDLKDKWRNMNGMGSGSVAREKFKVSNRKSRSGVKHEDGDYNDELANSTEFAADMDDDFVDVVPLAVSGGPSQVAPDVDQERLDRIIMEAIRTLNEPSGSQKTSIGNYIEMHYEPPQDFKELLSTKLRALAASGRLLKVKRRYRIAPYPYLAERKSSKMMLLEGTGSQREDQPSGSDNEEFKIKVMTRDEVDAELMQMWNMDKEAAAHAMRAVAEAEAIMAEAEAATKDAESAEAEAEAVKAFAEATRTNINNSRQATKLVIRACV